MSSKIFCVKCGVENSTDNNYCFKCGAKIYKEVNDLFNAGFVDFDTNGFEDVRNALLNLKSKKGFIIISAGGYYVQFINELVSNRIIFEAVSSDFIPEIQNYDEEFSKLSFAHEVGSNYSKYIYQNDLSSDNIIYEIASIFQDI